MPEDIAMVYGVFGIWFDTLSGLFVYLKSSGSNRSRIYNPEKLHMKIAESVVVSPKKYVVVPSGPRAPV